MGHSRASKAESRERIVQIAAQRVREAGVDAVGVSELMKQAGLTHGGFYRHFDSRETLLAESIERALRDGAQGAFDAETNSALDRPALLLALVDWYLGAAHRDNMATGCAVTSLAADVARSGERVRSAYTRQVEAYIELFARLMTGPQPAESKRAKAVAAWASLVGALSMARAVNDPTLSREILDTARDGLRALLG